MKSDPFWDERLTPQENKAVEMVLNEIPRAEVAEELDVSERHLNVVLSKARKKGVAVPYGKRGPRSETPSVSLSRLIELRSEYIASGVVRGFYKLMAERTGLNEMNVYMRLYAYDRRQAAKRRAA